MINFLLVVVALALVAFLALMGLVYVNQDRMLFQAPPLTPDNRARFSPWAVSLAVDDLQLHGWYAPADDPGAALLVYFGGNAEEVSWNLPALRALGVSVLLFNYRSYGDSEGAPSEAALQRDALAIVDHGLALSGLTLARVVVMGRSLGSGVATYVASQRAVAAVILVTPYDSLVAVGQRCYPWFPVSLLMRNRFESIRLAPQLPMPLLNLLAAQDEAVPAELGQRLGRAWGGAVTERMIAGADHINLTSRDEYRQALAAFLNSLPPER